MVSFDGSRNNPDLERVPARIGGILDHELNAFSPLPARAAQMSHDMKWQPLAFQQQFPEGRIGDTEGASLDACAVSAMQRATHMRILDAADAAQAMRGKYEAWLRMAGPIRPGAIEQIHQFDCRTTR